MHFTITTKHWKKRKQEVGLDRRLRGPRPWGGGCPWHPGPRHIGAAPHGASCLLSPLRTGTLRPWACPRGRKLVWDLAGSTLVLFLSPATGSCLREQFQEVGDSKLSLVSWKPLKGSWAHTQERRETRAAARYTLSPSLMPLFCDPYLKTKNVAKATERHTGMRPKAPQQPPRPHKACPLTHLEASRRSWSWPRGAAAGTWG